MNWKEAQQAFWDQKPVTFRNPTVSRNPIQCSRIAEISLRCQKGERPYTVIGGMDKNENCIYHAPPEYFEITKEENK